MAHLPIRHHKPYEYAICERQQKVHPPWIHAQQAMWHGVACGLVRVVTLRMCGTCAARKKALAGEHQGSAHGQKEESSQERVCSDNTGGTGKSLQVGCLPGKVLAGLAVVSAGRSTSRWKKKRESQRLCMLIQLMSMRPQGRPVCRPWSWLSRERGCFLCLSITPLMPPLRSLQCACVATINALATAQLLIARPVLLNVHAHHGVRSG